MRAGVVLVVEDLGQQRLPGRRMVAAVRQAGLTACLVHFGSVADVEALLSQANHLQPCVVVLSTLFGHLLDEHLLLAARLRDLIPGTHVTLAGPLPALDHARLLAGCQALDSVLCGEPEAVLPPLATHVVHHRDWAGLPGLASRVPDLHLNPLTRVPIDLDDLPDPARDDDILCSGGVGFATVEASRGCYHACSLCLPTAYQRQMIGAPYRWRSIPRLVDEMERLYGRGVRLYLFDDQQILPPQTARRERVQAWLAELERRRMRIAFTIKCRPDDVEFDLMGRLQSAGLIRVFLGVESGCQATLRRLNKGITVAQNGLALGVLDHLGIVADFQCLMFHPWSTVDTMRAEIDFLAAVLGHVPTVLTFHEVTCYAGTPIHAALRRDFPAAVTPGAAGGLGYVIDDAGAEWLRRVARRVFAVHHAADGVVARVTRAWFEILLAQRFGHAGCSSHEAAELRERVRRLNAGTLDTWRAMLEFVQHAGAAPEAEVAGVIEGWAAEVCRQAEMASDGFGAPGGR